MTTATASWFGSLLREHRLARQFTQETLAERAGVSVRSIQALERGESHPHLDTLRRLLEALALPADEREAFITAGSPLPRQRSSVRETVARDERSQASQISGEQDARDASLPTALETLGAGERSDPGGLALPRTARATEQSQPAAAPLPPQTLGASPAEAGSTRREQCAVPTVAVPTVPAPVERRLQPTEPPSNLPSPLSSFVGRSTQLSEIKSLLSRSRLLTLSGPGGIGKTRLALQTAADLLPTYPHGAWLVDLAPLSDPSQVPQAVASALDVHESARRPLLDPLVDGLRGKRLLLILDNCEHVIETVASLTDALLRSCPLLQILATSREALGITGEVTWRAPSLGLPEMSDETSVDDVARAEAVQLFVERARAVQPRFDLTDHNAEAVAQVCRRLDGIPLALELAAGLLNALPVAGIAVRLDQRFQLLTRGSRAALPRQRTLRATIDWSYNLLQPAEQTVFEHVSVFAGPFSLEAAEAVCADENIASHAALGHLLRLVDTSLVVAEGEHAGTGWYRLLETLRQYGLERLAAGHQAAAVRDRHAAYYLQLAERAGDEMRGSDGSWLRRLERDLDNFRAAMARYLGHATSDPDATGALRIAAALDRFWTMGVHRREGLHWLDRAISVGYAVPPEPRAHACLAAGGLAHLAGEHSRAMSLAAESVALYRQIGNSAGLAEAFCLHGQLLRGDWCGETSNPDTYGQGTAVLEEGVTLARRVGEPWLLAQCLIALAATAREDAYPAAQAVAEEGLRLWRQVGNLSGAAQALRVLGWLALRNRDFRRAKEVLPDALAAMQSLGDKPGIAVVLSYLGDLALARGDLATARLQFEESLAYYAEFDFDQEHKAQVLSRLGDIALKLNDEPLARRRYAESLRAAESAGSSPPIAAAAAAVEAFVRLSTPQVQQLTEVDEPPPRTRSNVTDA